MNKIGLLPCAGSATRLMNLPKFMLPLKYTKKCLLTKWIDDLINVGCDKIIVACSPTTLLFVNHIDISSADPRICIKNVGTTITMNDTIIKALDNEVYDCVIVAMPDTYVEGFNSLLLNRILCNDNIVGAYLWNIRKDQLGKIGQCKIEDEIVKDIIDKDETCNYNFGWGVLVFKREFSTYLYDSQLHPGYSLKDAIVNNVRVPYQICIGQYFDCGTVDGYTRYLNYNEAFGPTRENVTEVPEQGVQ